VVALADVEAVEAAAGAGVEVDDDDESDDEDVLVVVDDESFCVGAIVLVLSPPERESVR
jgi:hypothetical protein